MRWHASSQNRCTRLLGGTRPRDPLGCQPGDRAEDRVLLDQNRPFLEEGYRRIKLKIGPGRDVEVVRQVRERYPDDPAPGRRQLGVHARRPATLQQLDAFDLLLIEQPLAHDDIIDHARLQAAAPDADLPGREHPLGRRRAQGPRPRGLPGDQHQGQPPGGLLEAKRVHDRCLARGVPVWCGGMHEFGIGRAANVAIATLPGFTIPGDVSGSDKYYRRGPRRAADPGPEGSNRGFRPARTGRRAGGRRIQAHTLERRSHSACERYHHA